MGAGIFPDHVEQSAPLPPASFGKPKGAIPSLTGVRGIAAIWVSLTHAQPVLAAYLGIAALNQNSFFYNGFRGVDLFFVLSGFILMRAHAADFKVLRRDSVSEFYLMRFCRVYPLNAIVIVLLVPIGFAMPSIVQWFRFDNGVPIPFHSHDFSIAGLVQSVLLAQCWTYFKLGEWNGPSWSLSAEVFGYALFPMLAYGALKCRSAGLAGATAIASLVILVMLMAAFGHANDNPTGTFGLVRMLFCFISGIMLSRLHMLWPGGRSYGTVMTIAALLAIALALSTGPANNFTVFALALLVFGLAYQTGPVARVMSSPVAMFMGRISFSFYLVHYIPLRLALWAFGPQMAAAPLPTRVLCLLLVAGFCVAAACLLHHYVELPSQGIGRSIRTRRRSSHAMRLA